MKVQRVEMETDDGLAEATKDAQGEPWEIAYPWGDDRFYGTKSEVEKRMRKRIKMLSHNE